MPNIEKRPTCGRSISDWRTVPVAKRKTRRKRTAPPSIAVPSRRPDFKPGLAEICDSSASAKVVVARTEFLPPAQAGWKRCHDWRPRLSMSFERGEQNSEKAQLGSELVPTPGPTPAPKANFTRTQERYLAFTC